VYDVFTTSARHALVEPTSMYKRDISFVDVFALVCRIIETAGGMVCVYVQNQQTVIR